MYLANPLLEASRQAFKSVVDLMKIHCLPTVAAKKKSYLLHVPPQFRTEQGDSRSYNVPFGPGPFHVCQEGFPPCGSPPAPCQCGPHLSCRVGESRVLSGGLATRQHFTLTCGLLSVKPFYCFCPKLYVSFESLRCLASWGQLCMEGAVSCPFELITD